MIDVPVSSVASDAVPQLSPEDTTVAAATELRRPAVEAVLVCDQRGAVVGIVTESDIVAVVAERGGERPVESIMSAPVVSVKPSIPIGLAADRMRAAGIARLPVVAADETVVGLVTREALAPYLSRHRLEIEWKREPLSLDASDRERSDAAATE